MKNSRKIVRSEMLETVRERERELYSNEISFINYAEKLNMVINDKKDRLYAKDGM